MTADNGQVQIRDHCGITDDVHRAGFDPPLAAGGLYRTSHTIFRLSGHPCISEAIGDIDMQRGLIRLQCQHVVTLTVTHLRRNRGLTAHRIDSNRAVTEIQEVEQLGDRGDLIRFVVHRNLTEL